MGNCTYWGKPAGLLRSHHSECAKRNDEGGKRIVDAIAAAPSQALSLEAIFDQVDTVSLTALIPSAQQQHLISIGWKRAVENALHDGILSLEQEDRLKALVNRYSLSREELDEDGTFTRVVKSAVIRDLLDEVIPRRFVVQDSLPFNLQKNEVIVWAFKNCDYLEDRTHHQHVGASHGVGVRIAKGVYYRTSSFKGHVIDRTERQHVDKGMLALTTKHLYFAGSSKTFRVAYGKIVSFRPFRDGIGIFRDAANAKAQIFVTYDGWFTHNLATNLARLA
jgi:hypothetical protein